MLACSFQRAMSRSVAGASGLTATTRSLFIERSCLTRRFISGLRQWPPEAHHRRLIEVVVWPFLIGGRVQRNPRQVPVDHDGARSPRSSWSAEEQR